MGDFLKGYAKENSLDPVWLKELPYFLKLREIDLFGLIQHDFDLETIDDAWCLGFMNGRKELIDHDIHYIDYDWESLSEFLR
jgi:Ser/Thr protein kinase RdoA (MazF antagonist)